MFSFRRIINVSFLLACSTFGLNAMNNRIDKLDRAQREKLIIDYLQNPDYDMIYLNNDNINGFSITKERVPYCRISAHDNGRGCRAWLRIGEQGLTSFAVTQEKTEKIQDIIYEYINRTAPEFVKDFRIPEKQQLDGRQLLFQKNQQALKNIAKYLTQPNVSEIWVADNEVNGFEIALNQPIQRCNKKITVKHVGFFYKLFIGSTEISSLNDQEKIINAIPGYMAKSQHHTASDIRDIHQDDLSPDKINDPFYFETPFAGPWDEE